MINLFKYYCSKYINKKEILNKLFRLQSIQKVKKYYKIIEKK